MGFIRDAFREGYRPASIPTIVQINIPQKSQTHGNTNPVFRTSEKEFPTNIPSILPKTAPSKLIMIDSYKNCMRILFFLPPMALTNPISFVLSVTDTSMIFISPTAAPTRVMIPITSAHQVIRERFESKFFHKAVTFINYEIAGICCVYPPSHYGIQIPPHQ